MVVGGTIQSATEMMGIGAVGAGANLIVSGVSAGASKAIIGAGKGAGQVLGGIEGGIVTARKGIIRGLRAGNVFGVVGSVGEGAREAGAQTAVGVQTAAQGTVEGVQSVSVGLLSGLNNVLVALFGPVITGSRAFSAGSVESPVGRWISFLAFLLVLLSNVSMWATFTSSIASSYYFFEGCRGEEYTKNEIPSLLFLICYGPGSFLSFYGLETRGLRK